ncbi:MAG TPA: four helix bundle protein, partial [Nitrospirae bacterium]|nr:four helix bundle protein [Nitrospirota bacterium]
WAKDHPKAGEVRKLCYQKNKSYKTYKSYLEASPPEVAANTMVCLIHQTNYLLDRQLRSLEKGFLNDGGFTERLYHARSRSRRKK